MGLNYSRLNNKVTNTSELAGWNNLHLSNITKERRDQLKRGMDDFTGFTWRGVDAFQAFGAFIINNKNTLKFYNGPTYSNEYTKPMFESAAGQLTGVTFTQQKIDFTIGVYWISEDHYRQLIYWLHPYAVDTLTFDFEDNWYYQVKLASVENGNRYVVGTELINIADVGEPPVYKKQYMYYTEMKVTFEVQGPNCIYRKEMYEFKSENQGKDWSINTQYTDFNTDLPTSFQVTFDIDLSSDVFDPEGPERNTEGRYSISLKVKKQGENTTSIELFNIALKYLTYQGGIFSIKYDSETGLCFWNHGDSEYHLLTRLSTLTTGSRFVESIISNSYMTEGCFNNPDFNVDQLIFEFSDFEQEGSARQNTQFLMRARSNII